MFRAMKNHGGLIVALGVVIVIYIALKFLRINPVLCLTYIGTPLIGIKHTAIFDKPSV